MVGMITGGLRLRESPRVYCERLPAATKPLPEPSLIVLDTHVVLEWLAFRDPRVAPALDALAAARTLRWIATEAMRDEYIVVLRRGLAARIGIDLDEALAGWRHAVLLPTAVANPRWRCRDASDQKFVDLSLERGAAWLLTRDRDLLALGRGLRAAGLRIAPPERWHADAPAA
jgi:predicted nucleic acid-binding protein